MMPASAMPDRVQHLRGGGARARDDVPRRTAPVRRHLPSAVARVACRADAGEQHVERRHPELQRQRAVAIVGMEPVVAGPERQARGDEHGLMAGAADLKEDPVLVAQAGSPCRRACANAASRDTRREGRLGSVPRTAFGGRSAVHDCAVHLGSSKL